MVVGVNMSVSITRLRKSGTKRTDEAARRSYQRSFSSRYCSSDGAVAIHLDVIHAGAELQLAAERSELADEIFEDQADSGVRTAHAFQVQRAEHDAKLAPVHVVLTGIAVPHSRAEQHFEEQRVG